MITQLRLRRPDDWHVHLRDGDLTPQVLHHTAQQFSRVLAMPNLQPPITTVAQALAYQQRLQQQLNGAALTIYHSLYLTETTSVSEVEQAAQTDSILGFKLYPAGATTHSNQGVHRIEKCYPLFAAMQAHDVVLQVHGEVVDASVDVFAREAVFIERALASIAREFPTLRIVFEHITTQEAVEFVMAQGGRPQSKIPTIAATITPQHLRYNRNALFQGGLRPHYYCLPILKHERHRQALIAAVSAGTPAFFLGSDSAPHAQAQKEKDCGCAGCYSALHAMALYADTFDQLGILTQLENFASIYGAQFYRLPLNQQYITLTQESWQVPNHAFTVDAGQPALVPLSAGETLRWQLGT